MSSNSEVDGNEAAACNSFSADGEYVLPETPPYTMQQRVSHLSAAATLSSTFP